MPISTSNGAVIGKQCGVLGGNRCADLKIPRSPNIEVDVTHPPWLFTAAPQMFYCRIKACLDRGFQIAAPGPVPKMGNNMERISSFAKSW